MGPFDRINPSMFGDVIIVSPTFCSFMVTVDSDDDVVADVVAVAFVVVVVLVDVPIADVDAVIDVIVIVAVAVVVLIVIILAPFDNVVVVIVAVGCVMFESVELTKFLNVTNLHSLR